MAAKVRNSYRTRTGYDYMYPLGHHPRRNYAHYTYRFTHSGFRVYFVLN